MSFSVDIVEIFAAVLAVVASVVVDVVIVINDVPAIADVVVDDALDDATAIVAIVFVKLLCERKPKWTNISIQI